MLGSHLGTDAAAQLIEYVLASLGRPPLQPGGPWDAGDSELEESGQGAGTVCAVKGMAVGHGLSLGVLTY